MNILIAGATGLTGTHLTRQLLEKGHQPIALVRESSDTSDLPEQTELRQADLLDLSDTVCDGADVVVFAAGAGGDSSEEMTRKIDRDSAKKLVDIAANSNAQHFIMLSSVGAGNPDPDSDMANYLQAKHDADEHLMQSGMKYTIVRPVALTKDDGVRDIKLGDDVNVEGKAARGDVAAIITRAIDDPALANKVFLMESLS